MSRLFLRSRIAGLAALILATMPAWSGYAQTLGPVSTYYLTAGQQSAVVVVQGGAVLGAFATTTTASGNDFESPIVVFGNTIRTANSVTGTGNGYEYSTLTGLSTGGGPFTLPAPIGSAFDATTDGTNNYVVDYTNGTVYQLGLDYSNPAALFSGLGTSAFAGIAYDPTNNSLWVAGWSSNLVIDFAMNGTPLSSFSATGATGGNLAGFALDPATNTLWMETSSSGVFVEYSRGGVLQQTVTIPALVGVSVTGGEFSFTAVPEPAPVALMSLGVLTLAGFRRWRRI